MNSSLWRLPNPSESTWRYDYYAAKRVNVRTQQIWPSLRKGSWAFWHHKNTLRWPPIVATGSRKWLDWKSVWLCNLHRHMLRLSKFTNHYIIITNHKRSMLRSEGLPILAIIANICAGSFTDLSRLESQSRANKKWSSERVAKHDNKVASKEEYSSKRALTKVKHGESRQVGELNSKF